MATRDALDLMPEPSTTAVPFRPGDLDGQDIQQWATALRAATRPVIIVPEPAPSAEALLRSITDAWDKVRTRDLPTPLSVACAAAEDYLRILDGMREDQTEAERLGEPWPPEAA